MTARRQTQLWLTAVLAPIWAHSSVGMNLKANSLNWATIINVATWTRARSDPSPTKSLPISSTILSVGLLVAPRLLLRFASMNHAKCPKMLSQTKFPASWKPSEHSSRCLRLACVPSANSLRVLSSKERASRNLSFSSDGRLLCRSRTSVNNS